MLSGPLDHCVCVCMCVCLGGALSSEMLNGANLSALTVKDCFKELL